MRISACGSGSTCAVVPSSRIGALRRSGRARYAEHDKFRGVRHNDEAEEDLHETPLEEAHRRLGEYGFNELHFKRRSALARFLVQFHHLLTYVLLSAAAVCAALTLFTEEDIWSEVIIIMLVVVLNTIIGFGQEGKAEQALEALNPTSATGAGNRRFLGGRVTQVLTWQAADFPKGL